MREMRKCGVASSGNKQDGRLAFEKDRDRVLYSDYFRRLAAVTQVVSASEGGIFHNRQMHSLKVAQVARRLSEHLLRNHPQLQPLLSPDVIEAAALAHDLGHPPFGHVAEHELCKFAESVGLTDGFEGNAQTFRIITRLASHRGSNAGLDLTRATLAATLKYPWFRHADPTEKHHKKFSAYNDDKELFDFAREGSEGDKQTIEAAVMDLADSITYSVHDLEDFYRAGLIPLEKICSNEHYRTQFLIEWRKTGKKSAAMEYAANTLTFNKIKQLLQYCIADDVERGTRREEELLETFRSMVITHLLGNIRVSGTVGAWTITMDDEDEKLCSFLHQLVWHYVIQRPGLATQQAGQIRVVRTLADFYLKSLKEREIRQVPMRFQHLAEIALSKGGIERLAVDIVASLAEDEAVLLFGRITGQRLGSLLERV